jgi:hypothetical protein
MTEKSTSMTLTNDIDVIGKLNGMVDSLFSKILEDVTDAEGRVISTKEVDFCAINPRIKTKSEAITAMALGYEMGLNFITSLKLAGKFTENNVLAALKGKSMGIDAITSINNIHPIETKAGLVFKTGVHIIQSQLDKASIKVEIVEDFKPSFLYYTIKNNVLFTQIDIDANPSLFTVITDAKTIKRLGFYYSMLTAEPNVKKSIKDKLLGLGFINEEEELTDTELINNTVLIYKSDAPVDRITTIAMTNPKSQVKHVLSTSLQDAIDAGLMKGVKRDGDISNGKNNWTSHPKTMLKNFTTSTLAPVACGNTVMDLYDESQVGHLSNDTVVEEADVIED